MSQQEQLALYPFKKRMDIGGAMVAALQAYLKTISFDLPASTTPVKFLDVYDNWATFQDAAFSANGKVPIAVVAADEVTYDASNFTPRVLEDTWMSNDLGGWVLFATSEAVLPITVVLRAKSKSQRRAMLSAVEDAFNELGSDASRDSPIRYGKLLALPDYFSRKARFTLLRSRVVNTEDSATQERWLAELSMEAHAVAVKLEWMPALSCRVRIVDGASGVAYTR